MSEANLPRSHLGRSATQTSSTKFSHNKQQPQKNVRAGKTLTLSINIPLKQANESAQFVDCKTGTELRLEPCGLRRHDVAAVGDVGELLHGNRIKRESDLHLTIVHAA